MSELTVATRTWLLWFLAIALPGTVAEIGLQTQGLPLIPSFFFMVFVITVAVGIAEIQESLVDPGDLETIDETDLQDDIDRELNGRE